MKFYSYHFPIIPHLVFCWLCLLTAYLNIIFKQKLNKLSVGAQSVLSFQLNKQWKLVEMCFKDNNMECLIQHANFIAICPTNECSFTLPDKRRWTMARLPILSFIDSFHRIRMGVQIQGALFVCFVPHTFINQWSKNISSRSSRAHYKWTPICQIAKPPAKTTHTIEEHLCSFLEATSSSRHDLEGYSPTSTRNSSIFIILLLQSIKWIFYFSQPHRSRYRPPPLIINIHICHCLYTNCLNCVGKTKQKIWTKRKILKFSIFHYKWGENLMKFP